MDKGKIEQADPQYRQAIASGIGEPQMVPNPMALPIRPPWVEEILQSNRAILEAIQALRRDPDGSKARQEALLRAAGKCTCGYHGGASDGGHSEKCPIYLANETDRRAHGK